MLTQEEPPGMAVIIAVPTVIVGVKCGARGIVIKGITQMKRLTLILLGMILCATSGYAVALDEPMSDAKVSPDFNFNQPLKLYLIASGEREAILDKIARNKLAPLLQKKNYQIVSDEDKYQADLSVVLAITIKEGHILLNVYFFTIPQEGLNKSLIVDAFATKVISPDYDYEADINEICLEIAKRIPDAANS